MNQQQLRKCLSIFFLPIVASLLAACANPEPDPVVPEYLGAEETDSRILHLGDVFDRVNELNELEWDGRPVPGASIKMLLVADGTHEYANASASLLQINHPFASGQPLESSIGTFPAVLMTAHRFVEIMIPADAQPGFHWLLVTVDEIEFGPIRIEIADPAFVEKRAAAFASAEQALAEAFPETPFLVSGLFAPIGSEELRTTIETDDLPESAWPIFATRLDEQGAIVLEAERPSDLLVLVDAASGSASIHSEFALASWTLYNYPAEPPRGGYNGWWWKRPGMPSGGTCGTAWCNYPFPGNRLQTISNQLAIAVPPIDPLDWWRGNSDGWICGNGWFHGRRGPGGFRMGPWWPTDSNGTPKPKLGGPMPEEEDEERRPPVSAPRRPPGVQPPPAPTACTEDYVEAVSKYTYGKPPYGTRVRGSRVGAPPAIYSNLPEYEGNLRWARIPKNWTRNGGYEYGWTRQEVDSELKRNQNWWAQYCIALSRAEIVLPDSRRLQRFAQRYKRWIDDLPQPANPDVVMGLSGSMTQRGVALYKDARKFYAKAAGKQRLKGAIHILFMPRVVARTGHTGNRGRPTEASFTDPGLPFVVLNELDNNDSFILVHELIHALGRPPGKYTWDHQSGDPRAMSRVTRRTIRQAAGLSAARLLDYAEYDEILSSGNLHPKKP
ncbi:MAG: hypothetical protein ABFS39_13930 [Pseudomonadota bacterium]